MTTKNDLVRYGESDYDEEDEDEVVVDIDLDYDINNNAVNDHKVTIST
jgi:hypothetical protein